MCIDGMGQSFLTVVREWRPVISPSRGWLEFIVTTEGHLPARQMLLQDIMQVCRRNCAAEQVAAVCPKKGARKKATLALITLSPKN
jgi:hypothetical protein